MNHLVLLGDSIFDNERYVPGGPSVADHLRRMLPDWRVTLLAIDGAAAEDVPRQLAGLPGDATHLVVSVGGNDALDQSGVVRFEPAASFAEVLTRLDAVREEFRSSYRRMLRAAIDRGRPVAVCTVYDAVPGLERAEAAGLCLFNDAILREAFRVGVPVIDLRLICDEPTDYSPLSPIEPSAAGGGKIARAVAAAVTAGDRRLGSQVLA